MGSCLQELLVASVGEQGVEPDTVPLELQEPIVALLDGAAQLPQGGGLFFLHEIQDLYLKLLDLVDDLGEAGVHLVPHRLDEFLGGRVHRRV